MTIRIFRGCLFIWPSKYTSLGIMVPIEVYNIRIKSLRSVWTKNSNSQGFKLGIQVEKSSKWIPWGIKMEFKSKRTPVRTKNPYVSPRGSKQGILMDRAVFTPRYLKFRAVTNQVSLSMVILILIEFTSERVFYPKITNLTTDVFRPIIFHCTSV